MKAHSIATALAVFAVSGSFTPAFARPYLYVSGFSYSGSAKECLRGAKTALKEAGFKRDLETEKYDGDAAGEGGYVSGYLKSNPVAATIECDAGEGMTSLGVSGLNDDLTFEKYEALYDAEW